MTHRAPRDETLAVEIPQRVKQRLGLDVDRSWVVLSEWNDFMWPGPDLRRAVAGDEGSVAYGMLPPGLFNAIRDRFLAIAGKGSAHQVSRTE